VRIRNTVVTCLVATAIMLLSSCDPVYSIHPFYGQKDLTFDSRLLGTWFAPNYKSEIGGLLVERAGSDDQSGYMISFVGAREGPSIALPRRILRVSFQDPRHAFP